MDYVAASRHMNPYRWVACVMTNANRHLLTVTLTVNGVSAKKQ